MDSESKKRKRTHISVFVLLVSVGPVLEQCQVLKIASPIHIFRYDHK
jgi:hypothetical protein